MGYYTYVNVEVNEGGPNPDQVAQTLAEETGDPDAAYWKTVLAGGDEVKWYEREADMRRVSLRHPEAVFTLRGEGENPADQWVEYYQDGKLQAEERPEWTPPPFDPANLK